MSIDPVSSAADHEARYESLMSMHEAWELCRSAVELAGLSLEERLESARSAYDEEQRRVAHSHRGALHTAWEIYKEAISEPPSESRREAVAAARSTYTRAAAELRATYDAGMERAAADYLDARRAARTAYDSAVEEALSVQQSALDAVRGYFGEQGSAEAPPEPVVEASLPEGAFDQAV
ncbi:MAG TPA: hypothetical protein VFN50_08355 [Acidimicrobiales bacterium]|nr:hypothetical protein [Acidimicrobiales bacterium]